MTPEELLALTPAEREALPLHRYDRAQPDNGHCTGCIRCTGCAGCTGCTYCTDCHDCTGCVGCVVCFGCVGCAHCQGVHGGQGLRYVYKGVQLTAEQWAEVRRADESETK